MQQFIGEYTDIYQKEHINILIYYVIVHQKSTLGIKNLFDESG